MSESNEHFIFRLKNDDPWDCSLHGVNKKSGKIDILGAFDDECMETKIIMPYRD